MQQNIYDNPIFHAGYSALRQSRTGLNEVLEQPAIDGLLQGLARGRVLDLGCGEGGLCLRLLKMGAAEVVGIDISRKMLAEARRKTLGKRVSLVCGAMEEYQADAGSFDLVVSSLAIHYVADFPLLCRKVHHLLQGGGRFVFSMEHPIATCAQGVLPGWAREVDGRRSHWQVDRYSEEGPRQSHWFVDGVVKYHRTLATVINTLIATGFQIEQVLEPHALPEAETERPELLAERRRPPFLLIKARRQPLP